jgi:uncharacterized membrane protein YhaH (DUF805 family)
MKKYFEFSGTISGTNYFLRNLLSYIIAFVGGIIIGIGMSQGMGPVVLYGFLLVIPALWIQFATIYKRMNSLYPSNAKFYSSSLVAFQILAQIFKEHELIGSLMTLGLIVVGVILIFSDSNIQNHQG